MSLAADLASAVDPVGFARSLSFDPEPWQASLLRSKERRVLVVCARQVGKSTVAALKALQVAQYQPGGLSLIFSPSQRQSDELLAKVRGLYRRLGSAKPARDNGSELRLENGSRIVSLPGSESSTRGFSAARLLILDEAARASDDLLASAVPMVAGDGQLMVMSTPWGRRGFFFALHEDQGNGWQRHKITAYESQQFTPTRIAEAKALHGSFVFASDYECQFGDNDAQLFSTELVRAAFTPGVRPLEVG